MEKNIKPNNFEDSSDSSNDDLSSDSDKNYKLKKKKCNKSNDLYY